ncbi:NUMOD4 domain-containing protein [Chryseobacterium sp. OSA05B]|uniref:NUMOD4 domain-containing protein n=1 Tax=Chryseobacterium sp. OSA05B TaxID=2862650 RepID=UPI001CBEB963|nr:NUMOD4 domain-containing protein [Chryseobacterium sp. OSA05B]
MKTLPDIEDPYLNEVLYNTSLKDIPGEEWKIIQDFDSYAISNFGRVKSLERWTEFPNGSFRKEYELIKKPSFKKYFNKYLNHSFYRVQCSLSFKGIHYNKSVARLVYYYFVEKFNLKNTSVVISYKDGNSLHLYYKNLQMLSSREKSVMAVERNRVKNRNIEYQKPVKQYTVQGDWVKTFESIYDADKALGLGCRNILYVLQKKSFTAGGFRWFLKDYSPQKKDFLSKKANQTLNPDPILNHSLWEKLGRPPIDKDNPPACLNLSIKNLPKEHWKPLPEFEHRYMISDKGRIKRLSGWTSDHNIFYGEEQIMSINLMGKGDNQYLYIRLNRKEKRTLLMISRLLYYCFVEKFDMNDKTLVIDNQNEMLWDINLSKLSLCSFSSLVNRKKEHKNQSKEMLLKKG